MVLLKSFFWKNAVLFLLLNCIYFQNQAGIIPESDKVQKTIKVGCDLDFPPFCMVDENQNTTGFSVDLIMQVAREMELNVDFITGERQKLMDDLKNGKIDAIARLGRSPEREKEFDFTFPYVNLNSCLVVPDREFGIYDFKDFDGKTIAVLDGGIHQEFLNMFSANANIVGTQTHLEALEGLSSGKFDAVIMQRMRAVQLMRKLENENLKITNVFSESLNQSICFAVDEGNKELLGLLNDGLAVTLNNGSFRKLYLKWMIQHGEFVPESRKIIIGGDFNFPPYEFLDKNGNPDGFNVELTKAIAREMDLDVQIRLAPFGSIRNDLENGEIDMVQIMYYSQGREKKYLMSVAHSQVSYALVGREEREYSSDLFDLKELSFVVMNGDVMHDFLEENGFNFTTADTQEEALYWLSTGRFDCALVTKIPAAHWIKLNKWDNLKIQNINIPLQEGCYATLIENEKLAALFSEGIRLVKESGQYREIYTKWMGEYEDENINFLVALKYLSFFLIPITIILLMILFWSNTLRKQVRIKTYNLQKEIEVRQEVELLLSEKNIEIEKHNTQLKTHLSEIEQINRELKVAKEKAEESDRLKSAFLSNMSHEIRTPMNGILGFIDLLQNQDISDEEQKKYFDIVSKSGERLLSTINDIIEISKIESNQSTVNLSEIDVNGLLDFHLSFFKPETEAKGVQLLLSSQLGKPSHARTDKSKLDSILTNLLKNAVKFCSEGIIEFGCEQKGEFLQFFVKDTGKGIPKDRQRAIFNRFEQAELGITRGYEGSGLGLSISKAYAEMLGGEIWVESEVDKGSTFYFTIQFIPVVHDLKETMVSQSKKIEIPKSIILVAEDDDVSYSLLEVVLRKMNCRLIRAINGKEAVDHFEKNNQISLILMDLKMPVMDGYEATRKIRKMDAKVPIVAQTAYAMAGDDQQAYEAGCSDYISKPISKKMLESLIVKYLS